jgi:hypothetical protein
MGHVTKKLVGGDAVLKAQFVVPKAVQKIID